MLVTVNEINAKVRELRDSIATISEDITTEERILVFLEDELCAIDEDDESYADSYNLTLDQREILFTLNEQLETAEYSIDQLLGLNCKLLDHLDYLF